MEHLNPLEMKSQVMTDTTIDPEITTFGKSYIVFLLLILNIPIEQIGFLLVTVFVDSFFGVIREIKLKSPLRWEIFIWGIIKKLSILIIPFLIAFFGLAFKVNLIYVVQGFIYIIAANDVISIITNISSIRAGKRFKNIDFIEKGIHFITGVLSNLISAKLGIKVDDKNQEKQ